MPVRSLLLAGCLVCCGLAHATEIFMWVDARGRVQISDVVPDKYRSVAKKVDSQSFDVSAQDRADAQARAAQEKLKAAQIESGLTSTPPQPGAPNGRPTNSRATPTSTPPASSDCASLQHAYVESQECFAPYVMANGAIRSEAFKHCKTVIDPSLKCGIQPLE